MAITNNYFKVIIPLDKGVYIEFFDDRDPESVNAAHARAEGLVAFARESASVDSAWRRGRIVAYRPLVGPRWASFPLVGENPAREGGIN